LFFFYMTPAVPFMMIGLGGALAAMKRDSKLGNILVWTFLVIGVGVVGYLFYPILTGGGLPYDLWRSRMWRESWI
jgi:dolichyl-phosphate-mannose--protein O-mannosyl transferase